ALARLLERNGIEVRRLVRPVPQAKVTDVVEETAATRTVPAGSYHVPVAQPAGRLVRTLLDRHQDMGAEFIKRQLDRQARGLRCQIYHATAWSLPLAFGVPCLATSKPGEVPSNDLSESTRPGVVHGARATVAYLVAGDDDGVPRALCGWLRAGLRVHVAD